MTERRARRLLAVMFTDVVGYTAMMQRDEELARIVRRRHREALESATTANHGEVLQYLGDGSLTIFPSVADAARAAIAVQRQLRQAPAVPLRIGIHQGDISYDTQGAYGDSMNVASRIQSLAAPGGILISAKAHDEIKNRPDISTASLGTFAMKGVAESVEVYSIVSDLIAVTHRDDVLAKIHHTPDAAANVPQLNAALGGSYRIVRELGKGGMATVYLADDLRHERKIAVKVMDPELAAVVGAERFLAEIKTTANLQHPNIVPLFDSGVAGETPYYVMPYVAGESLERKLSREGPLPMEEAIGIASDIAEALQAAHSQGVIHRDIKPANVLLSGGRALVADFGIASAVTTTRSERLTQAGVSLGTPTYMSAEQAAQDASVDSRTDVYSLGCVLYEMITGDPPFPGSTMHELFAKVLTADAVPPSRLRGSTPAHVEEAVLRSLEKLPANRFASPAAFAQALRTPGASEDEPNAGRAISVRAMNGSRRPPRPTLRRSLVVAALLLLIFGSWLGFGESQPSAEGSQSLAVLPLINLIGDPEQEYFVAGMHEALISELAKIGALDVISRTSVTRYADTQLSAPQIANELGVTAVLEGGVQRAGGRMRVNVQLIHGVSDQQLWGQIYDEELTAANIFAIQSDVARRIARALRATLAPELKGRIDAQPTESFEAYDLYTRGRYLFNRFATHEDRVTAADLFQRAIAADSMYASAYVGLAEAYSFLGGQGYLSAEEALPQARAAVEKALELDETSGAAHAALGSVLLAELRFEEAEREFIRALELSPSSADVHRQYGRLLNRLSRSDESVREGRRAVELDPLSVGNRVSLTSRLFNARDYEAAISEGLNVLELAPDDIGALFFLGVSYVLMDDFDNGLLRLERAVELDPGNPFRVTALAFAHARTQNREEAIQLLQTVEGGGPVLKELAIVYGELGELDRAFDYLERAFEEDPGSLTYLPSDPTADSLRADPRMDALMRRVGL